MLDHIIANVRLPGRPGPVSIGLQNGRIAAIGSELLAEAPSSDGRGAFAFSGFTEAHIHLDKADILDRCQISKGTLLEAVASTSAAKRAFTVDDVIVRAAGVIEAAILRGTMRMRSFAEVDENVGLISMEALLELRTRYSHLIDLQICAFAQEGTSQSPTTVDLLASALKMGADLVGGCPYMDKDPHAHVVTLFDLAERHGVLLDFHADFDLDPEGAMLPEIMRQTVVRRMQGRVSAAHVTKLSALSAEELSVAAAQVGEAGVSLCFLPPTDLFLLGRDFERLVPRGIVPLAPFTEHSVLVTLGSNNILNPFTPFGDASPIRTANLYANAAQLSTDADLARCFSMVGSDATKQLDLRASLEIGEVADIVLIDASDPADAVRRVADVTRGWKAGVPTFERPSAFLCNESPMLFQSWAS